MSEFSSASSGWRSARNCETKACAKRSRITTIVDIVSDMM